MYGFVYVYQTHPRPIKTMTKNSDLKRQRNLYKYTFFARVTQVVNEQNDYWKYSFYVCRGQAIDGFEGNCYYIGKNPLYATGVYRQRMEGVFIKAKQ